MSSRRVGLRVRGPRPGRRGRAIHEHGQALRYHLALDDTVKDIARFPTRANVQEITDAIGNLSLEFYAELLTNAERMLSSRVSRDVTMAVAVSTADTANFRMPSTSPS